MQNEFYHDFKFDLGLPDPAPGPKYLYYPFNHETYYNKPKLTNLNYIEKPQIFTRIDLNIPVDEINIKPELYNFDHTRNNRLTEEDEIFLGERKLRKPSLVVQQVRATPDKVTPIKRAENQSAKKQVNLDDSEEEGFDLNDSVITHKDIATQLAKIIDKSFEAATDLKVQNHPTKKGVTASKVYTMVPNFNDIDKK